MAQTEKLIELVRKRRLIYDVSDQDYKDRVKRTLAWLEIAKKMGTGDGKHWIAKWKNLKDNYARFQKSSQRHSEQGYRKYKNWPWADMLSFLDDAKPQRSTDEVNASSQPIEPETIVKDEDSEHSESDVQEAALVTSVPAKNKNRREKQMDEPEKKTVKYRKNEQKQNKTLDEADHFFLSYAQSFKKFSPGSQARLKLEIATIFARYELEAAGETDNIPEFLGYT